MDLRSKFNKQPVHSFWRFFMRTTIKALTEQTGMKQAQMFGFVKVLESLGWAKVVDKIKTGSGKGKPACVYELDDAVISLLKGNKNG